ncbi:hypothetical protein [Cytobacillus praedii]|uniref:Uncharacterized protein n=1 Tax=Cytobacillus praedii TaxID=1742358 RepID=A0A4V2NUL5_9BACI|nr:hypothetical protein [Cytobacillus praedii]TCJ04874.1 hypothetical protein E0Y62_06535 [Cytobacillus praedii]
MKVKEKEIFSSCCAFGTDGTENVHVLMEDCPIKRTVGERKREKYVAVPEGQENPILHECMCIYRSGLHQQHMIPPCQYYQGTKKVTRDKKKKWKVFCSALETQE